MSVIDWNSRLPDFGGIRLKIVHVFRWLMLSNQPAPVRMTHLSVGRNAMPMRGMKKRTSLLGQLHGAGFVHGVREDLRESSGHPGSV